MEAAGEGSGGGDVPLPPTGRRGMDMAGGDARGCSGNGGSGEFSGFASETSILGGGRGDMGSADFQLIGGNCGAVV